MLRIIATTQGGITDRRNRGGFGFDTNVRQPINRSLRYLKEVEECSPEHAQYLIVARLLTEVEETLAEHFPDLVCAAPWNMHYYVHWTRVPREAYDGMQIEATI